MVLLVMLCRLGLAAADAGAAMMQLKGVGASFPFPLYGHWFKKVEKGGHFAAWEQPQLFAEEIRAAFRSLR